MKTNEFSILSGPSNSILTEAIDWYFLERSTYESYYTLSPFAIAVGSEFEQCKQAYANYICLPPMSSFMINELR